MLKCSTSLWSADLSNLAEAIRWSEPYSERFHLDVADGHYTPTMLFFPDLVKALRPHTQLPFEVHLMTTDPEMWIEPFADAGADVFIFCYDTVRDFSRLRPGRAKTRQADRRVTSDHGTGRVPGTLLGGLGHRYADWHHRRDEGHVDGSGGRATHPRRHARSFSGAASRRRSRPTVAFAATRCP